MENFLLWTAVFLMVVLLGTLASGLFQLTRDGEKHRLKSNKMMKMRIFAQVSIIAVLLLMSFTK